MKLTRVQDLGYLVRCECFGVIYYAACRDGNYYPFPRNYADYNSLSQAKEYRKQMNIHHSLFGTWKIVKVSLNF